MGKAIQDDGLVEKASDGLLYMGVQHSMGRKEVLRRVELIRSDSPVGK